MLSLHLSIYHNDGQEFNSDSVMRHLDEIKFCFSCDNVTETVHRLHLVNSSWAVATLNSLDAQSQHLSQTWFDLTSAAKEASYDEVLKLEYNAYQHTGFIASDKIANIASSPTGSSFKELVI